MRRLLAQGESALARITGATPTSTASNDVTSAIESKPSISSSSLPSSSASSSLLSCPSSHCSASSLTAYAAAYREWEDLQARQMKALMREETKRQTGVIGGSATGAGSGGVWSAGRVMLVHRVPLPPHCAVFLRCSPPPSSSDTQSGGRSAEQQHPPLRTADRKALQA